MAHGHKPNTSFLHSVWLPAQNQAEVGLQTAVQSSRPREDSLPEIVVSKPKPKQETSKSKSQGDYQVLHNLMYKEDKFEAEGKAPTRQEQRARIREQIRRLEA
jgi:hypothetical protein